MPRKSRPPSREQCLVLMDEYGMLANIKNHSLVVCDVSLTIGKALTESGHDIDLQLVEAAALLHDITKTRSLRTRENHAETGRGLLTDLGYPRTGKAVGEHIIPKDRGERLTEAEIIAYADKRVLHDEIVGLEKRFAYLMETYGSVPEARAYFDKMRHRMNTIEALIVRATGRPLTL